VTDRKYICPCDRHEQDIADTGHCICHLFVDETYVFEHLDSPPPPEGEGKWPQITVYGASWCSHTRSVRLFLNQHGVPYHYLDVDQDDDVAIKVEELNNGYRSTPTLQVDSEIVTEPSDEELAQILGLPADAG